MARIAIDKRINGLLSYILAKYGARSLLEPRESAVQLYYIQTDELMWFTCDDPVLLVELHGAYKFNTAAIELHREFTAIRFDPVLASS